MHRTFTLLCVIFSVMLVSIQAIGVDEDWDSLGGTWTFPSESDKSFFGKGTSGFNKAYYTKKDFNDFEYEVRLRKISANDGPIGLLVRYDDKRDEGYLLLIWPHGDYQFSRLIGEQRQRIGSGSPSRLNTGNKWNTIKIIGKGADMQIFINGKEQARFADPDRKYLHGKLGVVVHGGPEQEAEFRILSMDYL